MIELTRTLSDDRKTHGYGVITNNPKHEWMTIPTKSSVVLWDVHSTSTKTIVCYLLIYAYRLLIMETRVTRDGDSNVLFDWQISAFGQHYSGILWQHLLSQMSKNKGTGFRRKDVSIIEIYGRYGGQSWLIMLNGRPIISNHG